MIYLFKINLLCFYLLPNVLSSFYHIYVVISDGQQRNVSPTLAKIILLLMKLTIFMHFGKTYFVNHRGIAF